MLCALVLVVGLIAAYVLAGWPTMRRAARDAVRKPAGPATPGAGSAPPPTPQTLEGALTLRLLEGEITGPQYRQSMAALAARDAERHPLEIPPEVNPPEAA